MSEKIIALLVSLIASGGYASVVLLMAIQSACIPIPSEVVMPLAGYALAHTQMQLVLLATVAAVGTRITWVESYQAALVDSGARARVVPVREEEVREADPGERQEMR